MNWQDIPMPPAVARLPKDKRGLPIPFLVDYDAKGEPLFTINDDAKALRAIAEGLCGICGEALEFGDLWWVGGPLSAFHPHGMYVDGPMHCECSTYALQACPHLAAPKYTKRLDAAQAGKNGFSGTVMLDHTVMPDRPLVFVQGQSVSYDVTWPLTPDRKLMPVSGPDDKNAAGRSKWLHYEVWQHGRLLDEEEGLALIRQAFAEMDKQRVQPPRLIVPDAQGLIV